MGIPLPITPNSSGRALTLNNRRGNRGEGSRVQVPVGTVTIRRETNKMETPLPITPNSSDRALTLDNMQGA